MRVKSKKAQSIIEYICVTIMLAAVGVAAFFATNGGNFSNYQNRMTNKMINTNASNNTH